MSDSSLAAARKARGLDNTRIPMPPSRIPTPARPTNANVQSAPAVAVRQGAPRFSAAYQQGDQAGGYPLGAYPLAQAEKVGDPRATPTYATSLTPFVPRRLANPRAAGAPIQYPLAEAAGSTRMQQGQTPILRSSSGAHSEVGGFRAPTHVAAQPSYEQAHPHPSHGDAESGASDEDEIWGQQPYPHTSPTPFQHYENQHSFVTDPLPSLPQPAAAPPPLGAIQAGPMGGSPPEEDFPQVSPSRASLGLEPAPEVGGMQLGGADQRYGQAAWANGGAHMQHAHERFNETASAAAPHSGHHQVAANGHLDQIPPSLLEPLPGPASSIGDYSELAEERSPRRTSELSRVRFFFVMIMMMTTTMMIDDDDDDSIKKSS